VKDYVRSCNKCQANKASPKPYGPHQALPIPPYRWHTVTIDFAGPFVPSGEGSWDMVLIVVDKLTKRTHFIPSKEADKATDTARRFFDGVVRLHGTPSIIVSDRDSKFTSLFWATLFERFGTRLAMSSANHPQSDGQTERMVRTLKEMLRSSITLKQTDWTDKLAALEFAYNNSIHPSTSIRAWSGSSPTNSLLTDGGYETRCPDCRGLHLKDGVFTASST
jgi:transposase InsO family protein